MAGKHRKPSVAAANARRVAVVGTASAALMTVPGSTAWALPEGNVDELLDLIADCESDGRNIPNYINDSTHTAFGPWQITNTTWRAYGGRDFGETARHATIDEQRQVALRILAARPNGADWDPSRHCWGSRADDALRGEDVTAIHPTGGPGSEAIGGNGGGAPAPTPPPPPPPEAGPPAPVPPPPAPGGGALTYTVQSGDILDAIARRAGTTWQQLAELNGLANPHLIFPGNVIRLTAAADTHIVQPGENLTRIAAQHGTTASDLAAINQLENPHRIFPGQVITLGGQGIATATAAVEGNQGRWTDQAFLSVTEIATTFGIETVTTRLGHRPTRDRAADFMTFGNVPLQEEMAEWLIAPANRDRLGLEYVISRQRIAGAWTGWRWTEMDNRGTPTANHMDHNHAAFRPTFTYAGPATQEQAPSQEDVYTVRPGDTLGRIAAQETVPGGWRSIYTDNAATIGPNPHRIEIGMELVLRDADGTNNLLGARPEVP